MIERARGGDVVALVLLTIFLLGIGGSLVGVQAYRHFAEDAPFGMALVFGAGATVAGIVTTLSAIAVWKRQRRAKDEWGTLLTP